MFGFLHSWFWSSLTYKINWTWKPISSDPRSDTPPEVWQRGGCSEACNLNFVSATVGEMREEKWKKGRTDDAHIFTVFFPFSLWNAQWKLGTLQQCAKPKGASIYDVRKIFWFFDPPACPQIHATSLQPPLLRLLTMSAFEGTPNQCGRHVWKPPKLGTLQQCAKPNVFWRVCRTCERVGSVRAALPKSASVLMG